jgi:hypothetical protein
MEKNKKNPDNKGGGFGSVVAVVIGVAALGGAMNSGDKEPSKPDHVAEAVADQGKGGEPVWKTGIALDKLIDSSKGTERRAYIGVLHFWEHGYTEEQAAGMICNFMGEGSKLDPNQRQHNGGPAIGIAQWEGSRKQQLYAYAGDANWANYNLQLDFASKELNSTEQRADARIRGAETVWGAIAAAVRHYERPRDQSDSQIERRYQVCEPILGELATVIELDLA